MDFKPPPIVMFIKKIVRLNWSMRIPRDTENGSDSPFGKGRVFN